METPAGKRDSRDPAGAERRSGLALARRKAELVCGISYLELTSYLKKSIKLGWIIFDDAARLAW